MDELKENEILKARLEMALARIAELEKQNQEYLTQISEMRKIIIENNPADSAEKN